MRILVVDANAQRGFATVPIDAKRRVVVADNGREALHHLLLYRSDSSFPKHRRRTSGAAARPRGR